MYEYFKEGGYVIKLTKVDTFRIGNIGEIYEEDMRKVSTLMKKFLEK